VWVVNADEAELASKCLLAYSFRAGGTSNSHFVAETPVPT
jgi:hypothetical protein